MTKTTGFLHQKDDSQQQVLLGFNYYDTGGALFVC